MLLVSCSDPGIVSIREETHTSDGHMRALSLNEEEFAAFTSDDKIYNRCMFY